MLAFVCYLIQIKVLFLFDHLKHQWENVREGYKRAIRNRVERTRSGALVHRNWRSSNNDKFP